MFIIICMRLSSPLLRKVCLPTSTVIPSCANQSTEVIVPSVTHKRVDVKEKIQEPSEHHGVTTNSTMSVEDFKNKVGGNKKSTVVDGKSV